VAERIIFAIAAATALGSGVAVVTFANAFRATVALIVTLLSVAVIFLLLAAPFVAAIQVIVYAGAIVVMFLFVLAYLGDRPPPQAVDRLARYEPIAWLLVIGLVVQAGIVLANSHLDLRSDPSQPGDIGSPDAIGDAFVQDYIVPFEAVSAVLLVAAVGAVLLAKRAVRMERGR
jgi:NADH:ubiquinone oxidoreductase subunit 6 (subunit J)